MVFVVVVVVVVFFLYKIVSSDVRLNIREPIRFQKGRHRQLLSAIDWLIK